MRKLRNFFGGRLFPCALLTLLVALAIAAAAIYLPRALAPIALAERLFALVTALTVVNATEPHECKLPKLVLAIMLPWTGSFLCLLSRRKKLPPPSPKPSVTLYAAETEYFPVGRDMYEKLLPDLENARKFIWLEYYIVAHGAFFDAVLGILERKAAAGLDVRLLYDDFGCSLLLPRGFEKEMKRRGVKAKATRKVRFPSRALNRRNHRKIAVVDGEIAYTGGVNLADEYVGETIRFGHWKDTALRVTGQPAAEFAKLFAEDAGIPYPDCTTEQGNIPCKIFADGAEDSYARAGVAAYCDLIYRTKQKIYINTPYLAPDGATVSALKTAAAEGKDVRIMIPHIPDKRTTFLITKSFARELAYAGVKIREYTAGFLHAKSAVADGKISFVSSYNLDFRSLYLQAECGLTVDDETLAEALEQDFLVAWRTGTELKKANFFERKLCAVLRLFAPLV